MIQTSGVFVDVTVTSSSISSSGPYLAYADASTDLFLIDVDYVDASGTTFACADANGKTADCHTAINGAPFGPAVPDIYYGGFANALGLQIGTGFVNDSSYSNTNSRVRCYNHCINS